MNPISRTVPRAQHPSRSTLALVDGFSLVELLIVIAIMSVLAALLLPTLNKAIETARRVRCLHDRKQGVAITTAFANDHAGAVPRAINWGAGERELNRDPETTTWGFGFSHYAQADKLGNDHLMNDIWHSGIVVGQGALIGLGYSEDPDIHFCQSFKLPPIQNTHPAHLGTWRWNQAQPYKNSYGGTTIPRSYYWEERMSTDQDSWGLYRGMCSVTEYWYCHPEPTWLRMDIIAAKWQEDWCSPLMLSCANTIETWSEDERMGTSHDLKGVAGGFFDGSARWIDVVEVGRWGDLGSTGDDFERSPLTNCDKINVAPLRYTMQAWARKKATIRGD